MTIRFTPLASGSRGNSSYVQVDGFGLLLDAGLGPKELTERLTLVGLSPLGIKAMILTHTHSDHWNDRLLAWMCRRRVPLYCHPTHHTVLNRNSPAFGQLLAAGLVHAFDAYEEQCLSSGLRFKPLPVRHDGGETFGFRLEGPRDLFGRAAAVGYVSDLGTWDEQLANELAEVDLLAVEFNHDLELERQSKRPAFLVARVLGDEGHLSNDQAAALVRAVLARSSPGRLRHLVQLHLSEECNRPTLARRAAREALAGQEYPVRVHTAEQTRPGKTATLEPGCPRESSDAEPNSLEPSEVEPGGCRENGTGRKSWPEFDSGH